MPNMDGTGPINKGFGRGGYRHGLHGQGGTEVCTCPKCGHTQPHTRGIPCTQTKCEKCGAVMVGRRCLDTINKQD